MPNLYAIEFFKTVLDNGDPYEKARALRYLGSPVFVTSNSRAIVSAIQPIFGDTNEAVIFEAITSFSRVCTGGSILIMSVLIFTMKILNWLRLLLKDFGTSAQDA